MERNDHPVTDESGPQVLFCAYCGRAESRTDAVYRRFNTGFSGCCNDNLIEQRPQSFWQNIGSKGLRKNG